MKSDYSEEYSKIKTCACEFLSQNGLEKYLSPQYVIVPGLCDVHVHFREPGYSYKETIATGCAAAAHGGYTAVCTMPNLSPAPDCASNLSVQSKIIEKDAKISVIPYGTISRGQLGEKLSGMEEMCSSVCAFSDDGRGVQSDELMRAAMQKAKSLNKIIAAHCEDKALLNGGYIHDGVYAKNHGHVGISSESEYRQVERDLRLAKETGCAYHVCHVSTKESVNLIRMAKSQGINVTCETAPHYLLLCDEDLKEDGNFKMNPPLRSREDMMALSKALCDGTIDMIATDHAPHSIEEKSHGLEKSSMGVTGLETAFPVMYTGLVKKGVISLEQLMCLMCFNPRSRFEIALKNDFAVFEVQSPYIIEPQEFLSKGRATPFKGKTVFGKCLLTVHNGRMVYINKNTEVQKNG